MVATPHLGLDRSAERAAVHQIIRGPQFQTQQTNSVPDDDYEQEANDSGSITVRRAAPVHVQLSSENERVAESAAEAPQRIMERIERLYTVRFDQQAGLNALRADVEAGLEGVSLTDKQRAKVEKQLAKVEEREWALTQLHGLELALELLGDFFRRKEGSEGETVLLTVARLSHHLVYRPKAPAAPESEPEFFGKIQKQVQTKAASFQARNHINFYDRHVTLIDIEKGETPERTPLHELAHVLLQSDEEAARFFELKYWMRPIIKKYDASGRQDNLSFNNIDREELYAGEAEPPPTVRAMNNPFEDLAESVAHFKMDPEGFRSEFPVRANLVEELLAKRKERLSGD
jgi:hypothetical protein